MHSGPAFSHCCRPHRARASSFHAAASVQASATFSSAAKTLQQQKPHYIPNLFRTSNRFPFGALRLWEGSDPGNISHCFSIGYLRAGVISSAFSFFISHNSQAHTRPNPPTLSGPAQTDPSLCNIRYLRVSSHARTRCARTGFFCTCCLLLVDVVDVTVFFREEPAVHE